MGTTFEELSKAVAEVVAAASPSVVGVGPAGSGFVLAEGLVVTNAHNLRGELAVTFADGRVAVANVAGVDAGGDLAVLSVPTEGAPALQWAQRPATVGDVVVGLSRPAGGGLRAGVGFVTGLGISFRGPGGRMVSGALEHSATLARGSSGGPLVDGNGHLLGLNTHRAGEGLYLALPAVPELRARADALARGEEPRQVRLGVALAPTRVARRLRRAVGLPERDGALVHAVEAGGPADRAGIRRGDLITSVTVGASPSNPVSSVEELASALAKAGEAPEQAVVLGVVRGVEELAVHVDFTRSSPASEASV